MAGIARTPEAVLDFWLGPLRGIESTTEDSWRDRMLRWRVGVFARAFDDTDFALTQQEVCEEIHREGADNYFAPAELWDTPKGWLAKLIVLDQFGRSVHRGTPLAYASDALTAPMVRHICDARWDIDEYDEVERMWVYVALSHPEDQAMQELSVEKWTRWSADLIAASPKENRRVNQHVSWYFIKSIIEHSEAVLLHGKFPHRNPIMCRSHQAGDIHYLTSEQRPLWSFTQPPRPDYYALHGSLHELAPAVDCQAVDREVLERWQAVLGIAGDGQNDGLLDIFEMLSTDTVDFPSLYRHATLRAKADVFKAMLVGDGMRAKLRAVTHAIFKDPDAEWPPRSAKASVPRVIDVPALNLAIGCPLLGASDVRIRRATIDNFVKTTGFVRRPLTTIFSRYLQLASDGATYETTPDGVRRTVPINRRTFATLAGDLFDPCPGRDAALRTLYELLDMDYNGTVDAGEVVVALNVLCSGSKEDRLRVCFDVFDADGSGHLDSDELSNFIHTTLLRGLHLVEALFGKYAVAGDTGPELVLFSLADFAAVEEAALDALSETDSDGQLGRAEFEAWAGKHPLLKQMFGLSEALFGAEQ